MRLSKRLPLIVASGAAMAFCAGCISTTKEIPGPAPVVQVTPPPVVQVVPAPVVVPANPPSASRESTTTTWDHGAIVQKQTTTSEDNGAVQKRTTTTWDNNGNGPSSTTVTTNVPQPVE